MAKTFWDDVKAAINSGATIIADKSEEYLAYTMIKKEIFTLNHQQRKLFTELGLKTYSIVTKKKDAQVVSNTKIQELIKKIKKVQADIKNQEKQLQQLKKATSQKNKKSSSESKEEAASPGKTTRKTKKSSPKTGKASKGKTS